jgi:preprotein translocase subunit SecG
VDFVDIILAILNFIIVILALFLIGIILIQRGKGGGLAGAFGGVGGSSAFGTKTGDVFTKITIGVAIAWILLLMLNVIFTNRRDPSAWGSDAQTSLTKELGALGKSKGKDKAKSGDEIAAPSPKAAGGAADTPPPLDIPAIPDNIPVPAERSSPPPK